MPQTTNENPWAKGSALVVAGPVLLTPPYSGTSRCPVGCRTASAWPLPRLTDLKSWFVPILVAGCSAVRALHRPVRGRRRTHDAFRPRSRRRSPGGLSDSRVVPVGSVQFHVRSAAALLALLPLAVAIGTARLRTSRTHD